MLNYADPLPSLPTCPVEYEILNNDAEDCCYVTITGDLTVDDYKTIFVEVWKRDDYLHAKRAVWDFSGCRTRFDVEKAKLDADGVSGEAKRRAFAKLGMAAAQELAEFTRNNRPPVLPPRIAVITHNDIDFGTTRVYSGFSGLDFDDLRVFKSLESARKWLFE